MKYDLNIHLPAQLEGLMLSFQKADIPTLERSLSNIKNLIKDQKFQSDIKEYEKKRVEEIDRLTKKAYDAVKTIDNAKDFGELYVDIEEIKNDLIASVDLIEQEYWNHIKEYITLYIDTKPEEIKDEEH